jgi:tetratricopeptide (TPR) repeat protein
MRSSVRLSLLAFFLPIFLYSGNALGEQPWAEVRSPHFRVLTNGSSKDGRAVANEFEQMRSVFALRFKDDNIQSGPPLTIIATRDEATFRSLYPFPLRSINSTVAGEFIRRWESQFAVIRLDTGTDASEAVVYHEYALSVLHAKAHWLPVWLEEGLAEFYAYTKFDADHIYIGAPSPWMNLLRGQSIIPVTTMLEIDGRSPYLHDDAKMQPFYVQAWAMVHYLTFGPHMENGDKLQQFFKLLQDRVPQQKAFEQEFGDPRAFDIAFSQYVKKPAFPAGVLPPARNSDPKSFAERQLSPAEVDYELGCFHISARHGAEGRSLLDKAVQLDPKLAAAHEELGFLYFDQGKDDDAQKEWKQAVALDPSLPRSLFALTMTAPYSGSAFLNQSAQKLVAIQFELQRITQLAPKFAPPYAELALIEWKLGQIQKAYKDGSQAETLEPWRAGYHVLTGRILLHGNQPALAADYSRYVATHWFGSDHDEAVELWQAVPSDKRGDGPPLALDVPPGTEMARGKLLDVSCNNPTPTGGHTFNVTLMPNTPAGAKPLTFATDKGVRIGFSDTLWWGEDHFSSCHHLAGHPGVLIYKPQGPNGAELVDVQVRDDLPDDLTSPPPLSNATQTQAAAPPRQQ